MKAGFYECDITPALGMERPATYHKLFIEKINSPLKVRAAVFSTGKTTVALVGIDCCWIGKMLTDAVRAALPGISVTISASHTHFGGSLGDDMAASDRMSPLVRKLVEEESVMPDPVYRAYVARQTVTAVKLAMAKQADAELSFGTGKAGGIAFNRRYKMKDGHCASHPGKGNPNILDYAGPVDESVNVIGAWTAEGKFLGCVVNFACHACCDPISGANSDFVGYLAKTVRGALGEEAGIVFLNGACGDVTHIDNLSLSPLESGPWAAQKVGTVVGGETLKLLMTAKRGTVKTLAARSERMKVKRRAPSKESLVKAKKIVEQWKRDTPFYFAKERLVIEHAIRVEPEVEFELQCVQIGPCIVAALPGELFARIGLDIKAASKFPFTMIAELSNGPAGYIPTADAFDLKTGGGYETVMTLYSCFAPETAGNIVKDTSALIGKFKPEKTPNGPLVEPAGKGWDFGNIGPELD